MTPKERLEALDEFEKKLAATEGADKETGLKWAKSYQVGMAETWMAIAKHSQSKKIREFLRNAESPKKYVADWNFLKNAKWAFDYVDKKKYPEYLKAAYEKAEGSDAVKGNEERWNAVTKGNIKFDGIDKPIPVSKFAARGSTDPKVSPETAKALVADLLENGFNPDRWAAAGLKGVSFFQPGSAKPVDNAGLKGWQMASFLTSGDPEAGQVLQDFFMKDGKLKLASKDGKEYQIDVSKLIEANGNAAPAIAAAANKIENIDSLSFVPPGTLPKVAPVATKPKPVTPKPVTTPTADPKPKAKPKPAAPALNAKQKDIQEQINKLADVFKGTSSNQDRALAYMKLKELEAEFRRKGKGEPKRPAEIVAPSSEVQRIVTAMERAQKANNVRRELQALEKRFDAERKKSVTRPKDLYLKRQKMHELRKQHAAKLAELNGLLSDDFKDGDFKLIADTSFDDILNNQQKYKLLQKPTGLPKPTDGEIVDLAIVDLGDSLERLNRAQKALQGNLSDEKRRKMEAEYEEAAAQVTAARQTLKNKRNVVKRQAPTFDYSSLPAIPEGEAPTKRFNAKVDEARKGAKNDSKPCMRVMAEPTRKNYEILRSDGQKQKKIEDKLTEDWANIFGLKKVKGRYPVPSVVRKKIKEEAEKMIDEWAQAS